MASKRHCARIAVMQVLFERENREIDSLAALQHNIREFEDVDQSFAELLLVGVLDKESSVQTSIQTHAPDWPLERMDPIARCILYIGAYELLHANDAPAPVVMNECIEIAKNYGNDETAKFVNGVLNAISKKK